MRTPTATVPTENRHAPSREAMRRLARFDVMKTVSGILAEEIGRKDPSGADLLNYWIGCAEGWRSWVKEAEAKIQELQHENEALKARTATRPAVTEEEILDMQLSIDRLQEDLNQIKRGSR